MFKVLDFQNFLGHKSIASLLCMTLTAGAIAPQSLATPEGFEATQASNYATANVSSSQTTTDQLGVTAADLTATDGPAFSSETAEQEIHALIRAWGNALSPQAQARAFQPQMLAPFYLSLETLVATHVAAGQQPITVAIANPYPNAWADYVRHYQTLTVEPLMDSLVAYEYVQDSVAARFAIKITGINSDGQPIQQQANVALIIEKHDGAWVIFQENVW